MPAFKRIIPLRSKPNYPVKLNRSHKFYPNRLCFIFNNEPSSNIELVSNNLLTASNAEYLSKVINGNEVVLRSEYQSGLASLYNLSSFTLTATTPWELTFKGSKLPSASAYSLFTGENTSGNNFVGFYSTANTIWYRPNGGADIQMATGLSNFDDIHTFSLISDGGGVGSCIVSLYVDGGLTSTTNSKTAELIIDGVLHGFSGIPSWSFHGDMSHLRVSEGRLYSASDIKDLHANLNQILQPRTQNIFFPTVAAGAQGIVRRRTPHKKKPKTRQKIELTKALLWQMYNKREETYGADLEFFGSGIGFGINSSKKALSITNTSSNAKATLPKVIGTSDFTLTIHLKTPSSFQSYHYAAGLGEHVPAFFMAHANASSQFGFYYGSARSFGTTLTTNTEYVLTWMRRNGRMYGFYNNKKAPTDYAFTDDITTTDFHLASANDSSSYAVSDIFSVSLEYEGFSDEEILVHHTDLYNYYLKPTESLVPFGVAEEAPSVFKVFWAYTATILKGIFS